MPGEILCWGKKAIWTLKENNEAETCNTHSGKSSGKVTWFQDMPAPASSTSDPTWLYRGNNRGLLHPKHPGMCCQMKLWKESRGYLCVERNTEHCSFVNSTQCHLVTLKSSESMAPGLKKAFSFSELVRLCAVVWASFQFSFVDLAVLGLEISFFLSVGRNAFLTRACWCKWDGMARVGFPQDTEACVAHKHLKICSA